MRELLQNFEERNLEVVREALSQYKDSEIADEIVRLDLIEQAVLFRLLAKDGAISVFEKLAPADQANLLNALRADEVNDIIEELDPDDRARLFDEVPAGVAVRLLEGVSAKEKFATTTLLGYAPQSAGRIMTPQFVSIRENLTAAQAMKKVRNAGISAETIYILYVVDTTRRLLGTLSLKDLVLATPNKKIESIATKTNLIVAHTDEDQEDVARRLADNDLLAIPVVDREDRLVGIITHDDAFAILEQEETEDVSKIGGANPIDRPYMAAGVLRIFRSRIGWLLILFVAATMTGSVMKLFEESLEAVIALTFFIPLLIGTGGNAGSQTATTIVRAMAIKEVKTRDVLRVVWKEMRVGFLLGIAMATFAIFRAVTWGTGYEIALVVSLALLSVVILATFVGSVLPIAINKIGWDPAVVSAPFMTTLVDALGLLIYLSLATVILGL
ncbi:MAG: magnesium transporter [Candidatus Nanopelagicales bacterium]